MLLVAVLLLLHQSWANQVCVDVSNYNLKINVPSGNISEIQNHDVRCKQNEKRCLFRCIPSNETWFNGSSACLNSSVQCDNNHTVYTIHGHTNCFQTPCEEDLIMQLFEKLKDITHSQEKMFQLIYIKNSCPDVYTISPDIKKEYLKVEKQILHNILDAPSPENGSLTFPKSVSLNVFSISNSSLNVPEATIPIEAPQLISSLNVPKVWLPVNALKDIPQDKRIIGLASYMDDRHFQFNDEVIASVVVRIELSGDRRLHNLNPPIDMTFKVTEPKENQSELLCHYFDEQGLVWKHDGCETETNQEYVTCKCSHTTAFAILLVRTPIDAIHWNILSHISYIGSGLSLFFSALSLVLYMYSRNHKMDISMSIHVSLSGALFLLNSTFLLSEWASTVELKWVCEFVAVLMHYSLLCCFTWMAIEALHLYLMLIKVFNTYYKHYLLKLSLIGWGIPGIIVATSLGIRNFKQFYGVTDLTMLNTNQTNKVCWITDESFFYSVNLVYFALIFIFNSGILMAVASSICKMKQVLKANTKLKAKGVPQTFSTSCQSGLTLLGLTCLLGITWGLAFLGSGYVNYPVLYLFCILNSLQGFFIFMWICLSAKKQRRREMEEKLSSTTKGSSDTKTD